MQALDECRDQLLRLVASSMPLEQLAERAGQIAAGYWERLDLKQRQQFRQWLEGLHADAQRLVALGPAMDEKVRQAEVAMGAMEAVKKGSPS